MARSAILRVLRKQAAGHMAASRWDEAVSAWEEVLKQKPGDLDATGNLALIAKERGHLDESVRRWQEAIRLYPENAGLWGNLGDVYSLQLRLGKAEEAVRHAVQLSPAKWDLQLALGTILWKCRKIGPALECCARIPQDVPEAAGALNLRGNILSHIGHAEEARQAYLEALARCPTNAMWHSNYLLSLLYDESVTDETIFEAHRAFGKRHDTEEVRVPADVSPGRVIRLGFVSADLRMHSVAFFLEPLLHRIDRNRFEVHLFSGVHQPDKMSDLLASHAARTHSIVGLSEERFKALGRSLAIDVMIDLSGHTGGNCLPAFGGRLAPLQGSWLGYPHSTGLRSLDFRLSDAWIEPLPESKTFSSENIVHISGGAHCYRLPGEEIPLSPLPMATNGGPTFICCNNSPKISPRLLRVWAELLRQLPGARLILKNGGFSYPPREAEVREYFTSAGVDAERVEIRPLAPNIRSHLEMYHEADIALDTYPYQGTTTTCEALWMGVPVVSLRGNSARTRHAVSLLSQAGMEDWIVESEEAYIRRVVEAVADLDALVTLRRELRNRVRSSSLGNPSSFALRFQSTIRKLWAVFCKAHGAAPCAVEEALREADEDLLKAAAVEAHGSGVEALRQGRIADAERFWRQAAESGFAPSAWVALAHSLEERGEAALAHEAWSEAYEVFSDRPEIVAAYAESCRAVGDIDRATEAYAETVRMAPDKPGIWMNLSALYRATRQPVRAEEAARRSLELKDDFPEAWNNLGCALRDQGRFDDAVAAFCRALELRPEWAEVHSNLVYLLNFVPGLSHADLREQHAVYDARQLGDIVTPLAGTRRRPRPGQAPLRIGFLSPDLRSHSVSHFARAAFPALARAGADIHVFSDATHPDRVTDELRSLSARWNEVGALPDVDLLRCLRDRKLDVLVELSGHTAGNRLPLLAHRAAPVQISWLGYPAAPESRGIDFFLTDHHIYPDGDDLPVGLLRLDAGALPYAPPHDLPVLDGAIGDGPLTFGAFHNLAKMHEGVWKQWTRLLDALPTSRLCVKCPQFSDPELLGQWMGKLRKWGTPLDRIEFLEYEASSAGHLGCYRRIDVALDTGPYNGATTTMEALSMGVRVLTIPGDTPAARYAGGLIRTFGDPDDVLPDETSLIERASAIGETLSALRSSRAERQRAMIERCRTQAPVWADEFLTALNAIFH